MKLCDVCNVELKIDVNVATAWSRRCQILDYTAKRSPCQIIKNRETAKRSRDKLKKEGRMPDYSNKAFLNSDQEAMRTCLRCEPDENGVIPKFLSSGTHSRICPSCTGTLPGVNIKNLSRIASDKQFQWT